MKHFKIKSLLLIFAVVFSYALEALAVDEKIYDFSGKESTSEVLKKVKKLNSKSVEIKVESSSNNMTIINYEPAQAFSPGDKAIFENIESNTNSDIINREIVLADPKTGRLFHLNSENKVFKIILIEPWISNIKLRSIRDILVDVTSSKIQKAKRDAKSGSKK